MTRLKTVLMSLTMLIALGATAPPLPVGLAPYINNGRFDAGDYRWLRGSFSGADAAEVANYQAIIEWRRLCRSSDMAETRSELAALGVNAGESLNTMPYRSLICSQVATLPEALNVRDWNTFSHDILVVRPLMRGFLAAVTLGEKSALNATTDLRDALNAKATGEQILRAGLDWASDLSPDGYLPDSLTPQQRGILAAGLAIAMKERDHANTVWLKHVVAVQGWPKRSQVGDNAAKIAWLLVQHADADPAFQVKALRLMEPLVLTGEASRKDYAYLYDRVMFKVVGRQRYGTQLICRNGRLEPMPLEDNARVDELRRAVGLDALAETEARSLRDHGPCQ